MIRLENITFTYTGAASGGSRVKDIGLMIRPGECVLLCGRSGCGKTTVTRLINGLIPGYFPGELAGSANVFGLDAFSTPMYLLSGKVGSVFQNPRTQFFNVDTDSEIVFGIENEALPPDELHRRLDQTLADLKIEHLKGRNIFELSGGEKQKIAFASVYAMNPDVYLLDEPSSNLDIASIDDLKRYLKLLKTQGKTIVIAEHRLYYLMDLADRIVYLDDGMIKKTFTPSAFFALSEHERTRMGLRAADLASLRLDNAGKYASPPEIPALIMENISISRGKRPLLEDISMKAFPGEVIAVVGPNGVGKTTFLRALCGLHKECTGRIFWKQKAQSRKALQKLSYMVMQDVNYELFADSVEAECALGLKDADPVLIEKTLKELTLWDVRERHPNTLSGGQKQRVAVAVSMVCKKELLVFDEPTSGLDYDSMEQVGSLLKKLSAGRVIFVVTHDYEFVLKACSRLLCFRDHSVAADIRLQRSEGSEALVRALMGVDEAHDA